MAAAMLAASIVRSAFGFGEALVAVPLLALVMPVETAAPLAVLASIAIAAVVVLQDWRHIHLRSAGLLIVATFFGIPFGLLLLKTADEAVIKAVLGTAIVFFSAYSLLRKGLELRDDRFAWIFGFVAGVFGGAYGLNGPPLAVYGSLRRWPPARFRATLQGYFLPASVAGMCGYWLVGLWTPAVNHLFLWSVPSIAAGIALGRLINSRLEAHRFSRSLHAGLCVVGLALLFQASAAALRGLIRVNGF